MMHYNHKNRSLKKKKRKLLHKDFLQILHLQSGYFFLDSVILCLTTGGRHGPTFTSPSFLSLGHPGENPFIRSFQGHFPPCLVAVFLVTFIFDIVYEST